MDKEEAFRTRLILVFFDTSLFAFVQNLYRTTEVSLFTILIIIIRIIFLFDFFLWLQLAISNNN